MTIRLWRYSSPPIGFAARHFSATIPIPAVYAVRRGVANYRKTGRKMQYTICSSLQLDLFFMCKVHGDGAVEDQARGETDQGGGARAVV